MKAIRFDAPGQISIVDRPRRDPGTYEVAVAIDRVGICATDIHIMHGTFPTARYPLTPGHEATGIVTRVGEGVHELPVGTRVVLDPGIACRRCAPCRRGRPNLCENRRAFGVTDDGAAAAELIVAADQLFALSPSTPAGAAVLAEPLACVVHAFDQVAAPGGGSVLIYGAGTVGLLAAILARSLNAAHVSMIDLDEGRLDRARAIGAETATTSPTTLPLDRYDLVVDATGSPGAITDGIGRVASGGSFLQIGVARPDAMVTFSPYQIFARELTIAGSLTTRHSFPRAIAMLDAGQVDHSLFTTEPLPLNRYADAIAAAEGGAGSPKVTIAP
jgi:2-desacetyl-2-hydroxyethyl bacteriochlorophyllide A dehydrogenase